MKVNWSGVLIAGSWASLIFAASAASSPYRRVRPDGRCVTTLDAAAHSDAGTSHLAAAAAIRRTRALAPTCCIFFWDPRTERLPFENMSPYTLFSRTLRLAEAYSTRTFVQSHSSSSVM